MKSTKNSKQAYSDPNSPLDETNRRLLGELIADPRITMSALAVGSA
jgi:hypothetical protein